MLAESNRFGIALLLLRIVVGTAFILHGAPKIGHASTWMDEMRFHPAAELQVMAAIAEFCGGWALLFGIATRLAAALISGDMLVAIAAVHLPAHQPFVASHGASMELPVVYLIGTIAIIIAGPGRWSVDAFIAHHAHWRRHARRDRITA